MGALGVTVTEVAVVTVPPQSTDTVWAVRLEIAGTVQVMVVCVYWYVVEIHLLLPMLTMQPDAKLEPWTVMTPPCALMVVGLTPESVGEPTSTVVVELAACPLQVTRTAPAATAFRVDVVQIRELEFTTVVRVQSLPSIDALQPFPPA